MKIYFLVIPIIIGILFGVLILANQENLGTSSMALNKKNLLEGSTILGNPDAKISIVEFGDYQCTFCYKFHDQTMKIILEQYVMDGEVNFVYKDFPLNGAPSIMASEASYCAQEQGKFWEYHDLIYENWEGENTGWLTRNALDRFAEEVKLNQSEFNSCMNDSKYRQKVLEIEQFAREIDVDATPSFIIFDDTNAYRIIGAQPFEKFEQVLNELL